MNSNLLVNAEQIKVYREILGAITGEITPKQMNSISEKLERFICKKGNVEILKRVQKINIKSFSDPRAFSEAAFDEKMYTLLESRVYRRNDGTNSFEHGAWVMVSASPQYRNLNLILFK